MVLEQYAGILAIITIIVGSFMAASYLPQLYKIWKRKSVEDLSLPMFLILLFGMLTWLTYGLSINNLPLIITNIIAIIAVSGILILYFKYKKT